MTNEQLLALKQGDMVGIVSRSTWGPRPVTLAVVSRVTATQIIFNYETHVRRFRRKSGYEVGQNRWNTPYLVAKDEAIALKAEYDKYMARQRCERKLSDIRWKNLTDEQLSAIEELVDSFTTANGQRETA